MKTINFLIAGLISLSSFAQQQITLNDCYKLLHKNYPISKQLELFESQNAVDLEVISTEKLPKLNVLAQATYQSDVTQMPIKLPNSTITPPNKDQYKTTLSVNQIILSGGLIDSKIDAAKTALKVNQKQVEVQLFQLKKQVNQLYFSILFLQKKKELLNAKKQLITSKLKEITTQIAFGTMLSTAKDNLEVEILNIEQQLLDTETSKKNLLNALSKIINTELDNSLELQIPNEISINNSKINRPEQGLFQLKKETLDQAEHKNLVSK